MKRVTFAMLFITTIILFITGILPNNSFVSANDTNKNHLNIVTTNKIQYEMVKEIVGKKHNVQFLFKDENDLLTYEYNKNILYDYDIDMFFYIGKGYEKWTDDIIKEINKNKVTIVDTSRGIRGDNPYYWTGVKEYEIALYNIKTAIQDIDPINKKYYDDRYNDVLDNLHHEIKNILKQSKKVDSKIYISIDNKLNYFYNYIDLNVNNINEDEVEEYIRKNNIDRDDVVILKDINTESHLTGYNIINLYSYSTGWSVSELIIHNYKEIYNS